LTGFDSDFLIFNFNLFPEIAKLKKEAPSRSPIYCGILNFILFSFLSDLFSQIWLIPLVDDCEYGYITAFFSLPFSLSLTPSVLKAVLTHGSLLIYWKIGQFFLYEIIVKKTMVGGYKKVQKRDFPHKLKLKSL